MSPVTSSIILLGATGLQVAGFCAAADADLRSRVIPDYTWMLVGAAGLIQAFVLGLSFSLHSCGLALGLLLLLVPLHARGAIGGGDVKLLAAAILGHSVAGAVQLLANTALAGGLLALIHLGGRQLPRPSIPRPGSNGIRRLYAAERWRILRGAPLPYGVAIACGGMCTLLNALGK